LACRSSSQPKPETEVPEEMCLWELWVSSCCCFLLVSSSLASSCGEPQKVDNFSETTFATSRSLRCHGWKHRSSPGLVSISRTSRHVDSERFSVVNSDSYGSQLWKVRQKKGRVACVHGPGCRRGVLLADCSQPYWSFTAKSIVRPLNYSDMVPPGSRSKNPSAARLPND
jgi:hypothetical protein